MGDEIDENDDDHWSEAMTEPENDRQASKDRSTPELLSSVDIPLPQLPVESHVDVFQSITEIPSTTNEGIALERTIIRDKQLDVDDDVDDDRQPIVDNRRKQPISQCRARSLDQRKCQKHYREMIEKQTIRNEELEQIEGDLRLHLEALDQSVPAVVAWNVWRMAQSGSGPGVSCLMKKQLECWATDDATLPITPSRHWDERVRDVEAERKEAARRAEEAKAILADKEAAIEERRQRLEEARKCNREMKEELERLSKRAAELGETPGIPKTDNSPCGTCECSEVGINENRLIGVGSGSSMGSADLEYFANLRELAQAEVCMKRRISELERREEAYMRTLQQADEMWSKMEGDTTDAVTELRDELDSKTVANRQMADRICQLEDELEKSKNRLIKCNDALTEITAKSYTETQSGLDQGEATVKDRAVVAAVRTSAASTNARAITQDQESLVHPQTMDQGSVVVAAEHADVAVSAVRKGFDKGSEAVPIVERIDREVDPVAGLGIDVRLGDDEDLPEHLKNWDWDELGCHPDVVCDYMVESSTGTDDAPKGVPTTESKVQAVAPTTEQSVGSDATEDTANFVRDVGINRTDGNVQTNSPSMAIEVATVEMEAAATGSETDEIVLSREELRNWYNIVDSVHHAIAKCENCSSKIDDTGQLAEKMKSHLRIKGLAGVKGPVIMDEIEKESLIASQEHESRSPTPPGSLAQILMETMPEAPVDHDGLPDETVSYRVPDDVAAIDEKISSLTTEIEGVLGRESSEILGISGEVASPEVPDDAEIPTTIAETTEVLMVPVPPETESELPEIFQTSSAVMQSQTYPTEESVDVDDSRISIPTNESPPEEKTSQVEIADVPAILEIGEQLAEIPREDSSIGVTVEPPEKLDDMISLTKPIEVESEASRDLSKKLSSKKSSFTPTEVVHESESISSAHQDEAVPEMESEQQLIDYVKDDFSIEVPEKFAEELGETISISQEDELEFEDAVEIPEQSLEFSSERDSVQSKIEQETFSMPTENGESTSELAAEEDKTLDETPLSFVTLRTPTISRIDVKPEIKEGIPSIASSEDERHSELDPIDAMPSFETIADEELQASVSVERVVPQDNEQMPDSIVAVPQSAEPEGVPINEDSTTITTDDDKQSTIIEPRESIHLETAIPETQADDVKADLDTRSQTTEARSHPDVEETKRPPDNVIEDIVVERKKIVTHRAKVRKPYLAIAKVESSIKVESSKSVGPCICKPRTCPLLGRSAVGESKRKVPRVGTEITQTTNPVDPKSLRRSTDESRLTTVSKRTWPSPEVETRNRGTIWPRRTRNKSTLTTACVDTQTDGSLVRKKIALEGIPRTRKDDYTCSGARPTKIEHGGCVKRVSKRHHDPKLAPVDLARAKLLGTKNFAGSTTSCAEKEITVVRHKEGSPAREDGELRCGVCARPMTPNGTLLSTESTLLERLKKMMTTVTPVVNKTTGSTCCQCKTSDVPVTDIGTRHKRGIEGTCDRDPCCPCPSETTKKKSSKSSRNKRNPETKDQAVMAHIPRSMTKTSSRDTAGTDVNVDRPLNDGPSIVKPNDSKIKVTPEPSSPDGIFYCVCEESSNDPSIAEGASIGDSGADKMPKVSCDCLLEESVSRGSSCNCTEGTN